MITDPRQRYHRVFVTKITTKIGSHQSRVLIGRRSRGGPIKSADVDD